MSIYRGAGGAGDAVNDASSEATLVAQLVVEAETAEANASASATAAAGSASAASSSASAASTSASNAATSATNAANSASTATTQATNAANSATAAQTAETAAELAETNAETAQAAAASSASAASTSASNAATSATNASNSASAAATSATNSANSATASATSATNSANSATAAAGSATTASTQATNASNSATAAASSATAAAGSATSASGSATTATTQAGIATTQAGLASTSASNASTSATNASNSASSASTSATNASNSASSAATSATNAAASYDSFDDRYLGSKSTAPTVDNDGNTLLVGALYFNSVDSAMKVWNGTAWLDAYASLSGALIATNNLADLTNTATARTNLGVAIGTNVQAYDAQLADVAGLTPSDNNFIVGNGTNFVTESGATARTSLGLGSIATQDSSNVTVTGGSINGTTVGATTASTGRFSDLTDTGLTATRVTYAGTGGNLVDSANLTFDGTTLTAAGLSDSGNLTFTGTGNRIRGDMSNATLANRVAFQNSVTDGVSRLLLLPNGTATSASLDIINSTTTTATAALRIGVSSTEAQIQSVIFGGSYLPLTMSTGGSERLRIDTSGNVGIGTSSPSYKLDVVGISKGNTLQASGSPSGSFSANSIFIQNEGSSNNRVYYCGANASTYGILQEYSAYSNGTPLITRYVDNGQQIFYTSNTERMRIDSTGNVGIGTSSPAALLSSNVNGVGSVTALNLTNSNAGLAAGTGTAINFGINNANLGFFGKIEVLNQTATTGSNGYMAFSTRGGDVLAERMRIDSAGNVGIAVSPSAWSGYNALQIRAGSLAVDTGSFLTLNQNAVNAAGGWTYINTGTAEQYYQTAGTHVWRNAASGTAGTAISFSERMRIDSSGNVGIGTSSPTSRLTSNGTLHLIGSGTFPSTGEGLEIVPAVAGGDNHIQAYSRTASSWQILKIGSSQTIFGTGGTERMRITSSGDVGIGASSTSAFFNGSSTAAKVFISYSSTNTSVDDPTPNLALHNPSTTTNNYSSLYFSTVNTSSTLVGTSAILGIHGARDGAWGSGALAFLTTAGSSDGPTERMRIDSSGNLLVGKTALPSASVFGFAVNLSSNNFPFLMNSVNTTGTGTHFEFYNPNGNIGSITTSGSATAYNTSSDYRLKENIAPMTGALNVVQQLKPVTYNWKADGSQGQGFIAHELQAVVPDAVVGEKDAVDAEGNPKYQGIDTSFLVATLTAAIQEQQTLIKNLTTRLNALEGK